MVEEALKEYRHKIDPRLWADLLLAIEKETNPILLLLIIQDGISLVNLAFEQLENIQGILKKYEKNGKK